MFWTCFTIAIIETTTWKWNSIVIRVHLFKLWQKSSATVGPIYLSIYLSIYLPTYLSIYLSICLWGQAGCHEQPRPRLSTWRMIPSWAVLLNSLGSCAGFLAYSCWLLLSGRLSVGHQHPDLQAQLGLPSPISGHLIMPPSLFNTVFGGMEGKGWSLLKGTRDPMDSKASPKPYGIGHKAPHRQPPTQSAPPKGAFVDCRGN